MRGFNFLGIVKRSEVQIRVLHGGGGRLRGIEEREVDRDDR